MNDFSFKIPQEIVFGVGALKRLPELLEKCGSRKMLIVSDRSLEKIGVVDWLVTHRGQGYSVR